MENSQPEGFPKNKSTKVDKAASKSKQQQTLTIQEAKNIILSKMRKQGKFVLPPSILRNHGSSTAPPITLRVPQFDLKRKRPSVMLYSQIHSPDKRQTRSQRLRQNDTETNNEGGGHLKESTNITINSGVN